MTGRTTITILDTPPSLNSWLSSHWRVRDRDKKRWQTELNMELHRWRLPRDCRRVEASVTFRFSDRRRRDSGNFTSTLEKALGDALRPDFLTDDDSSRFQVIHGEISSEVGPKQTTIVLDWQAGELAA